MAPENTVPAFEFALAHHADVLEVDVRLSRDRELMVIHDARLDRTTNGSGLVADLRATDISKLDAGYRFCYESCSDYPFRGCHVQIISLLELLEQFPDTQINIDIKDHSLLAVEKLARTIESCHAQGRVVVASFHHDLLSNCRERFPWLNTSASKKDVQQFYWRYLRSRHTQHHMEAKRFQLPVRYAFLSLSHRRFINAVHEAGCCIDFWTVNDPDTIRRLINVGADGIVTDRPDLASVAINRAQKGVAPEAKSDR